MRSDGSNRSNSSVSLDWLDRLDPTNRPNPSTYQIPGKRGEGCVEVKQAP